jgi:hypothetical protein
MREKNEEIKDLSKRLNSLETKNKVNLESEIKRLGRLLKESDELLNEKDLRIGKLERGEDLENLKYEIEVMEKKNRQLNQKIQIYQNIDDQSYEVDQVKLKNEQLLQENQQLTQQFQNITTEIKNLKQSVILFHIFLSLAFLIKF